MANWPSDTGFPQTPLINGYQESFADPTIKSSVDVGPPKYRRRISLAATPVQVSFDMTTAQVAIFRTFHQTTLQGGSLPFNWLDPIGKVITYSWQFTSTPQLTPNGTRWIVSFSLDRLPQ